MVNGVVACRTDEVLFKGAQDAVKTLQELDDRSKLRLYAHYKQATMGPAQGSRPSVFQQVARAKWDAWSELQTMSSADAMRGYCRLVDEFVPGWRENVQEGHVSQDHPVTTEAESASDEALFKGAQDAVKTLQELDDRSKLRLYAHYKQATMGPAQGSRPSVFQQVARAKWDAWSELQTMSSADAMRGYCRLVDEFVPGWRENVQEGHVSQDHPVTTEAESASDEALFKGAQDAVKTLQELDDRSKLRLYAHYKQATMGPAQGSRPSVFQQVSRAKWDAWSELQTMSSADAMRGYCRLVDEFVPGWRENVQEGHVSQDHPVTTEAESASDEALFKGAQDAVKTLQELDDRSKLRLYAHYKQATMGPAQGSRPSVFQQVARAKWDAWSELQNMSSADAMRGYCRLVDEFVPGWRENVQEGHVSQDHPVTTEAESASDEALFKGAQDAVKTLQELDDRSKLRLYAHYKQATMGPAQGSRPSVFQQVARAKWDAWSELQNMSSADAMRGYCRLVDEFVPGWRQHGQETFPDFEEESSLDRWGFQDTRFVVSQSGGRSQARLTSQRYPAISRKVNGLLEFFGVRWKSPTQSSAIPELQEPSSELMISLPQNRGSRDRWRAGTCQSLRDLWRLRRNQEALQRMPDVVLQPQNEEEVVSILQQAGSSPGFMVIPVSGRTGSTSGCPSLAEDSRPVVALDMRKMKKLLWIRHEDRLASIEAGITGSELKALLAGEGYTMGMELESMDFSTLGGWIATKAIGSKQSRYGDLDEMLVEVRVATSSGLVWQNGMKDRSSGSVGRRSNGLELPGLLLGSGGCLGVITAAVVRIHPLPERLEYDSLRFPTWDEGVTFLRAVSQLPRALKPAVSRLLDSNELNLAQLLREDLRMTSVDPFGQSAVCAALVVLEGSNDEVVAQRQELTAAAAACRGVWTGPDIGEVFHQMNFVVPYIRDLGIEQDLLLEALQLMIPWSRVQDPKWWPGLLQATASEHRRLGLPGALKLWKSLSPLKEGVMMRVYVACSVEGLDPTKALESFEALLKAAVGGSPTRCCWSDRGVLSSTLRSLKAALDPHHVLGAVQSP